MHKLFNLFNWVTDLVESFTFYGGGKGGGGGTQTSVTTNLPQYAKPYYQELLKQTGKNIFTTAPTVTDPRTGKVISGGEVTGIKEMPTYTGERVAGFTPQQQAVQQEALGLRTPQGFGQAQQGLGYGAGMGYSAAGAGINQALGYQAQDIQGGTFDQGAAGFYMNPYQQGVTDIALREARRQGDIERSRGALGAIGRGTFGSARQSLMQSEQDRNLAQNIGDIQAKGSQAGFQSAQQQFNQDQARRMQAEQLTQQGQQFQAGIGKDVGLAGLQAGLTGSQQLGASAAMQQTADLERLKAQAATAGEQQALQQKINDIKYQTAMEARDWQQKQLEFYSNILRGNAGALGSTQVQYGPPPSPYAGVGAGLQGLALYKGLTG
jgi:hypothetical protein